MYLNFIFINLLIFSTIFTISSNSWMSIWMGLEFNLMSMIPLLSKFNLLNSESTMKYFIVQTISSAMLFMTIMMMFYFKSIINPLMMMMNLVIMMKLGAAPLHFWYIQIIEGMSWMNIFILSTWQKIAPMILISYNFYNQILIIIILLSAIMASISIINQISIRKLMGYSSINHLSWMLTCMLINENLWNYYFLVYTLLSANIMMLFNYMNLSLLNQTYMFKNFWLNTLNLMINFLSLGGMPPFIGFMPKWFLINNLMENKNFMLSMTLFMISLINLYMYIKMMNSIICLNMFKHKWNNMYNNNNMYMYLLSFNSMFMLIFCSFMI
uniref:NADH-ubiquinone oxidoreductase chain 2 n=1 Tax=Stenopsyche tienmushanensis TaxID=1560151 RepID=A0A8A0Y6G7_9NEOP|nr:NADH dehydrogenase subunit 2 [Stenopsyche tienmushanensis]QSQ87267.1 NADH dehydrogenase subunit 2 [Stenopsyche tienmushanensis]UDU84904.1 NADH dehydrogenase subunit 2 [Stenopsyche tienmushanensis]